MAIFVINEWLWSDLSGDNGLPAQKETFDIIEKFAASEHRMIIIEGSPFDQKTWSLCRNTNPMIVQRIAGAYVANVRQNSDRCLILKPEEVAPLPNELASVVKGDDHYLIQAQLKVEGSVLVTTDVPLREIVLRAGLMCLSRSDFLKAYFGAIAPS